MARLNIPTKPVYTHEGARAQLVSPALELKRTVCACLLWEDTFYESGIDVADRIKFLIPLVAPDTVAQLAVDAREMYKLRHVPLLIVREMARLDSHKYLVSDTLKRVIQRPDELAEFLAIYWKDGRQTLSAQVKKGLAAAFRKFNAYQLAKYNRDNEIKLRDVLFLCHAKPKDQEQDVLWKGLIDNTLPVPDTWEVALSSGEDKKAAWERLLSERKLGGLALLRNLRNMVKAGVDANLIKQSLGYMRTDRILPFRFISAAKYVPDYECWIEQAMLRSLAEVEKLPGKTALLIDGSGSMFGTKLSEKSDLDRFEAAAALAIMARELCEKCMVSVFSYNPIPVPSRHGFALRDALYLNAERGGTHTGSAVEYMNNLGYDRIIVFTDEQSHQKIPRPLPGTLGYVVNVATYQYGIGYGDWIHIDGFSEAVLSFITESEKIGW